jgi:hypothetical protein
LIRKLAFIAAIILLFSSFAFAQSTTVSGTITDTPDGQAWFGGTYSFVFRVSPSNPTAQYFWNGVPFSSAQTIAGALDGSAHYSVSVPSSTSITPAGSTWDVTFCPLATAACLTVQSVSVTGTTQTFSPSPPSVRINMGSPAPNTRAYRDGELVNGALGQSYFNVTDTFIHVCNILPCTVWNPIGGVINVVSAPSGACTPGSIPQQVIGTGVIYTCQASVWAPIASSGAAAGAQGQYQLNNGGVLGIGNLSEASGVLTNGDDNINRGPNPNGVDIRFYGAHPVNLNSGSLVSTCSINASSSTMTVGTAANITNLDGLACVGAGPVQTMTTPSAPTVVPSGAASLSGTGVLVNSPLGSTPYSIKIAMCDVGYGCTAASPAATITNGPANLGMRGPTISTITSCVSGTTNTFTCLVGSTAEMSAGMTVVIKGTTDDKEFGGVKQIASVVDGTHFTYLSGVDASRGISTTTATGGTVYYAQGLKVVLPTPTGAGAFYLIYGPTTGAYNLIGVSLPANLGYSDATYNVWEYYGTTMSGGMVLPWWAPTTAPSSPFNDMLVTKITNISGTTVTVATPASTTVAGNAMRPDNVPAILAAYNASFTFSGGGGMLYFPVIPEVGGTLQGFTISSYLSLNGAAVSQASRLGISGTLKFNGNWNGDLTLNPIASAAGGFGVQPHNQIFVQGAYPGIWRTGGSWNGTTISSTGNGYLLMFDTSQYMYLTNNAFSAGGTTDFMGVLIYRWPFSTLGFGTWWVNNVFASGMTQGDGQTMTPFVIIKNDTEINMHYFPMSIKGMWFGPSSNGLVADLDMGEENQGLSDMPLFSFYYTGGTIGGAVKIHNVTLDTSGYSIAAALPDSASGALGFPLTLENISQAASATPYLTGKPFAGVTVTGMASNAPNLLGQNLNTTILSLGNNGAGGIMVPSVTQSAIISTGNITLTNNMGVLVQNGTGTITVDTTLGDGRGWDVICQSGSCTLTVNAGTLSGNGATGNIVIPANQGVHVFLKGGNAFAYGLGGGGSGGSPGGTTDALQYNGGGSSFGGVNSPTVNGNYAVNYNVIAGAAVAPSINLPGVPVNAQTGTTYTIGAANTWNDRGTVITASNSSAQTYTMVNPSTTGFGLNFFYVIKNIGTGTVTENASGFTVNGGTSLIIPPATTVFHWSDGVNYFASRIPDLGAFTNCTGAGNALQFTAATGLFSCGSSSSGVSSFTGDVGGVVSNNLSTGAVVLTFANAPVHKYLGNNTGTPAAPAYFNIVDGDLTIASHAALYNASNVWTALQDFSGATMKIPTGAGCTASASAMICYDSTNKNWHIYDNGADAIGAAFASAPTNGDCVKASVSSGNVLLADGGGLVCGIQNTTTTNPTTAVGGNSCSASATTVTMTGVTSTMTFQFTPNADITASVGWGSTGGLVIVAWPTANTLNYKICNQTATSITPGAVTWNVSVR